MSALDQEKTIRSETHQLVKWPKKILEKIYKSKSRNKFIKVKAEKNFYGEQKEI